MNTYKNILFRLFVMLFVFFVLRILFFAYNHVWFSNLTVIEFFKILVIGIRFDLVAIVLLNSAYCLLNLLPFRFVNSKIYQRFTDIFFFIPNVIAIFLSLVDTIYFRYTLKRMTFDIFDYLKIDWDFKKLLPQFLKDFWYILVILLILLILFIYIIEKVKVKTKKPPTIIISFVFLVLLVIAGRGGLQLKPLKIVSAGSYFTSKEAPLILNTPFSILRTSDKKNLKIINYYDDKTLDNLFTLSRNPLLITQDKKTNVVIIIVESLSTEHIVNGYTPFISSLMKKSFVADSFANGKRSIESLPATLNSLPSLMDNDFISSIYANNQLSGLAKLLKEKNYYTAFLHGGKNGTMNFEDFIYSTHFNKYYGMNEFNNDKFYDGTWGIYDDKFLSYCADMFTEFKKPFFAGIFTLSSHHPYKIPDEYEAKFPENPTKIQRTLSYTDFALEQFFEKAKKMPWFENTLFVITADHTSEVYDDKYKNALGNYSIPIIFYSPKNMDLFENLPKNQVMQQLDIMPTILDFIGYDKNYSAFGNSIFDTQAKRFVVNYHAGIYQLILDNYLLLFNGEKSVELYNIKNDRTLKNNLINDQNLNEIKVKLETFLKAIIQRYNNGLIKNKLEA